MNQRTLKRSSVEAPDQIAGLAIQISNRQRVKKIDSRLLKQIVFTLFADLKIQNANLEINLVDAKKMAKVNWEFLQHKGSTDVITFDYADAQFINSNPEAQLRGELFICVDDAVLQSKKFKTTWQAELIRYAIHGILHLVGHDDLQSKLRQTMKREENRLVRQVSRRSALSKL